MSKISTLVPDKMSIEAINKIFIKLVKLKTISERNKEEFLFPFCECCILRNKLTQIL